MAKCLIAGLPAAGKSTYIGALAYILLNPVINQVLMLDENPDDLSYLNKLIDPWLNLEKIERTTRGFANNIDLKLVRPSDNKSFSISLPDIAGEDYESIVNMNSDVIASWSDNPDALLLFINEWDNDVLKEQLGEDTSQYFNMWVKLCSIDALDQIQQDLAQIKETISTIDIENIAKVVQLDNTINLPSIGDINTVYFIRSKNATYRWDHTDGSYKCCGTGNDYTTISTISGGNASSIF